MFISKSLEQFLSEVARASDLSLKPWKHSVFCNSDIDSKGKYDFNISELILRVECRTAEGIRFPSRDLEIEIFNSGLTLNLTISFINNESFPILWHGNHSVWMNPDTGAKIKPPSNNDEIESLARRLRSSLADE